MYVLYIHRAGETRNKERQDMSYTLCCQDMDDEHFEHLDDALDAGDVLWSRMTEKERLACEVLEVWDDDADADKGPEYNWPVEGPRGTWEVTPFPDALEIVAPTGESYNVECRTNEDVWGVIEHYDARHGTRLGDWMDENNTEMMRHSDDLLLGGDMEWTFPDCDVVLDSGDMDFRVIMDGDDGKRVMIVPGFHVYDDVKALDEGSSPIADRWEDGNGTTVCYDAGIPCDDDGRPEEWDDETLEEWVEGSLLVNDTPESLVDQAGGDIGRAAREWVAWWFLQKDCQEEQECLANRRRLFGQYDMSPDEMVGWMTRYLQSHVEAVSEVTFDRPIAANGNGLMISVTREARMLGVDRGDIVTVTIRRKD